MAKEIYNKNAREKALLEEAYMNVYSETIENIHSPAMQATQAEDAAYKKYEVALHGAHIYDEPTPSPADYGLPPAGSPELEEIANRADPKNHPMAANLGYEGEEGNTLEAILPTLEFKPVKKQAKEYQYAESSQNMPAMSYTVVQQQQPVVTVTSDGKETTNTAEPNDIIMSGPSKEQYVVKAEKFPNLYDGKIGDVVIPEQGDRIVARVDNITEPITFTAPWDEDMILKRGDYLVEDPSGGYYRIAQQEYDQTYNPI